MIGVAAALVAAAAVASPTDTLNPQALPQLPQRGLARETKAGVELQTMQGRSLGVLPRLNLAPDVATGRDLLLRDGRGSLYVLDWRGHRVRQVSDGPPPRRACRVTDRRANAQLIVCKSTIRMRLAGGGLRTVARAPGKVGHWERAAFAPREDTFFAQWSAECEVPIAFLVTDGRMRPFGGRTIRDAPESSALGWLADGRAVVHFPKGACGSSHSTPGVYAVPMRGRPSLFVATPRFEYYWMWGG